MKDWAHQIRIDGNDAAHDEKPFAQEEAAQLLEFVRLLLTYVFTLPAQVAARRAEIQAQSARPAT